MDYYSILGPLSFLLFLILIYISSKEKPKKDINGNPILRTSLIYAVIGALTTIASFGILIFGLFFHENDETLAVIIFFLMLSAFGLPLFLFGINVKLIFNNQQMKHTDMLGKIKTIKWNEIDLISFGKVSLLLKIKGNNQTINLHQHTLGFLDFVDAIETNTNYTKQSMGLPYFKNKTN
ncbi:MAG: hypothetical protein AB8H03_28025 [Saprospiraceae bacterium]